MVELAGGGTGRRARISDVCGEMESFTCLRAQKLGDIRALTGRNGRGRKCGRAITWRSHGRRAAVSTVSSDWRNDA